MQGYLQDNIKHAGPILKTILLTGLPKTIQKKRIYLFWEFQKM